MQTHKNGIIGSYCLLQSLCRWTIDPRVESFAKRLLKRNLAISACFKLNYLRIVMIFVINFTLAMFFSH